MAKVPWMYSRCILCLVEAKMSEEHLIPQSIGGRLACDFLCSTCNSKLGHHSESQIKTDPSIRIAVQSLRSRIPGLAKKIEEGQAFTAVGPGGRVDGSVKDGQFKIRRKQNGDGSLILPVEDAEQALKAILKKKIGKSELFTNEILDQLRTHPDNQIMPVTPEVEIVKWSIELLQIDLSKGQLIKQNIPTKIAFEFLALHAQGAIYADNAALDEIRRGLLAGELASGAATVERLNADEYLPFHGIAFTNNEPCATVLIRLFGWLAFQVKFPRLTISGPRFAYTLKLDTNTEYWKEIS